MDATIIWSQGNTTVWQFSLNPFYDELSYWRWRVLNASEFEKAEAYGNDRLRTEFIVRRCTLRKLLSSYVTCDAQKIEFQIGEFGKPSVVGYPIHFSTSTSKDLGLIAISTTQEVGVDIQAHEDSLSSPEFDFLTASESRAIQESEKGTELFNRIWTRKEASIKAIGQGLNFPIQTLDVLPDDTEHCWLEMPQPVSVCDLPALTGYSAALAWHVQKKPAF